MGDLKKQAFAIIEKEEILNVGMKFEEENRESEEEENQSKNVFDDDDGEFSSFLDQEISDLSLESSHENDSGFVIADQNESSQDKLMIDPTSPQIHKSNTKSQRAENFVDNETKCTQILDDFYQELFLRHKSIINQEDSLIKLLTETNVGPNHDKIILDHLMDQLEDILKNFFYP